MRSTNIGSKKKKKKSPKQRPFGAFNVGSQMTLGPTVIQENLDAHEVPTVYSPSVASREDSLEN